MGNGGTVVNDWTPFLAKRDAVIDMALGLMAADIERLAKQTAPIQTGELKSSIMHMRAGPMHFQVWAGVQGPSVAYARYQEYGVRMDGSHVARNYSSPGTGSGFMRKSGKRITDQSAAYFKVAEEAVV